jgi:site-specific recombinase XerD
VDHPGVKVWLDGYMAIVAEIDAGGSAGGNACYPRNRQVVAPLWLHVAIGRFLLHYATSPSGRGGEMPTKLRVVGSTETTEMRPVAPKGRKANVDYRIREHLTEAEVDKLLAALKRNRHGHRDWLIGLLIYRHGLRVSEACDLRWDDIDLGKRTIVVRRLKGSTDSSHYLERDEHKALGDLWRANAAKGVKAGYVFVNERGAPFGRMGIGRMIERAGEAAGLPFPVHVHMLRHSTGYALAARGMDTRRLQHYLGHASITNTVRYTAMSPEPFRDIWR